MIKKLIQKLLLNDELSISKALTIAEEDIETALLILGELPSENTNSICIGITGSPGAGKSTLVNALTLHLAAQGNRVAILAVDPSSPFTGGALLGDRIRMQSSSECPGVFIRSFATRGAHGGVSSGCYIATELLRKLRFDYIIIETVGVGQGEIDIMTTADITAVVLVPGMGDEVQLLKSGLMEIADLFIINKADREGVLRLEKELILSYTDLHKPKPTIVKTVAINNSGILDLVKALIDIKSNNKEKRFEVLVKQLKDYVKEYSNTMLSTKYKEKLEQTYLRASRGEINFHEGALLLKEILQLTS